MMNNVNRIRLTKWLLVALAALGTNPGYAQESEPFVYALQRREEVTTLDYLDARTTARLAVVSQIMEGLMGFDTENDRDLVPRLAKSHQRADRRTYVFRLRDAVYFHPHSHGANIQESERVTAEDVVFSLQRAINSKSTSQHLFGKIESIKAISDDLVKIKLGEPDDYLLYGLATNLGFVTCKTYYESLGLDPASRKEEFSRNPIGTGPYRLVEELGENGHPIVLRRSKTHRDRPWVASSTAVETIVFRYYENLNKIADGMRAGEIHMTGFLLSSLGAGTGFIDHERDPLPVNVKELTPPVLSILTINLEKLYLSDPLVRRLLNSAVDKETIKRINPISPKQLEEFPQGYRYYLDITNRYLDREGSDDIETMLRQPEVQQRLDELRQGGALTLLASEAEDPVRDMMLEIVRQGIQDKLGISVEIKNDFPIQGDPEYDLLYLEWTPDIPAERDSLAILYPLFHSNTHSNRSNYKNAEVDQLFAQIQGLIDEATKESLYGKIQSRLLEDSPHIWLPSVRSTSLVYQEDYELDSGSAILIYYTSFLKNLRERP